MVSYYNVAGDDHVTIHREMALKHSFVCRYEIGATSISLEAFTGTQTVKQSSFEDICNLLEVLEKSFRNLN